MPPGRFGFVLKNCNGTRLTGFGTTFVAARQHRRLTPCLLGPGVRPPVFMAMLSAPSTHCWVAHWCFLVHGASLLTLRVVDQGPAKNSSELFTWVCVWGWSAVSELVSHLCRS